MSQPTIGVRPAIFATGPTELASTSAGGRPWEPPQWTGFALRWPGCHIDHSPGPRLPGHDDDTAMRTPRTLRWVLHDRGTVVANGWADVYTGETGDLCVCDFGDAASPVRSIEVTASDPDRLPALLETLEVVPLVELIGMVTPPLPEPMPPGPMPDDVEDDPVPRPRA